LGRGGLISDLPKFSGYATVAGAEPPRNSETLFSKFFMCICLALYVFMFDIFIVMSGCLKLWIA